MLRACVVVPHVALFIFMSWRMRDGSNILNNVNFPQPVERQIALQKLLAEGKSKNDLPEDLKARGLQVINYFVPRREIREQNPCLAPFEYFA